MYRIILFLVLFSCISLVQAKDAYVSDQLEVTLRKGTSTRHEIVRMLPSGTKLDVMKVDSESGYTKVRTRSGVTGWVLTRFLMDNPAARDQITSMGKKLTEIELDNRRKQTKASESRSKISELANDRTGLSNENRKLTQQLTEIRRTASSALALNNENKSLKANLVEMERKLQALSQENQTLKDRTARDWFMVGAGVVLLGMLIGIVIPRIRWRRKSSWDTL